MSRSCFSHLTLSLLTLLELLGCVTAKGVAVMIPSSSTSPVRRVSFICRWSTPEPSGPEPFVRVKLLGLGLGLDLE